MSSSLFCVLLTLISTLESLCFARIVRCATVILSYVHGQQTTSKTFTWTRSSSPVAQCVKHRNRHLEMRIHRGGNGETIGYTSKRWYSWLGEMRQRDGNQDNIWNVERMEPQEACSGIWNASPRWLLLYPILFIQAISVPFSIWSTGWCPSLNNIPGSTNSTSSGWWCLHILASLNWTSHIARWCIGVVRRWKHFCGWLFQLLWQLIWILWQANGFPSQMPWWASRT